MDYRIETPADAGATAWLDDRIYEHNSGATGRSDGRLFARNVVDGQSGIVGGIAGWTWAGACEISLLWIHQQHRGQRLGERLLAEAEQEAVAEGCVVILLKSYSFQAPEFYQKYGYVVEHVVKDFPPGYQYYTLIKRLSS